MTTCQLELRQQYLTHWGQVEIDDISQTTTSSAFSWMKVLEFRLKFLWSLFLSVQLTIFQHLVQIMAWRRPGDKPLSELIALNLPVRWTPSGIYDIEGPSEICTHSAEVRLAVSGAQPLFTLGLLMFALSLVDFLSLLLSPSTYFKIFFGQKYHVKDAYKNFMLV